MMYFISIWAKCSSRTFAHSYALFLQQKLKLFFSKFGTQSQAGYSTLINNYDTAKHIQKKNIYVLPTRVFINTQSIILQHQNLLCSNYDTDTDWREQFHYAFSEKVLVVSGGGWPTRLVGHLEIQKKR